jgi:hypothetical protein
MFFVHWTARAGSKVPFSVEHVATSARFHIRRQVILDRAFFATLTSAFPVFVGITVLTQRPPSLECLNAGHATGSTGFQRRIFETAITHRLPFLVVDHYPRTFAYRAIPFGRVVLEAPHTLFHPFCLVLADPCRTGPTFSRTRRDRRSSRRLFPSHRVVFV